MICDNFLPDYSRAALLDVLTKNIWQYGWMSNKQTSMFPFMHVHFAGSLDHADAAQYECSEELFSKHDGPIANMWRWLRLGIAVEQHLVRCYANGMPYGSDGDLHTDSSGRQFLTYVYYPHDAWSPDWGGETVFFTADKSDIIEAIYPKPNRLLVFQGNLTHVARGVTRRCPQMRITLMFKTRRPPHLMFLIDNATRAAHSGRTLFVHLLGTCALLRRWGCDDDVCRAGLYHSIYGTRSFKHESVKPDEDGRGRIREMIGREAEELVFKFHGDGRNDTADDRIGHIEAANALEQGAPTYEVRRILNRWPRLNSHAQNALMLKANQS
jgi:SM-20-related protein